MTRVVSLYRYPVKGLSPEAIGFADLQEGKHFPGDRLFALENGPSGFNPAAAEHMPKIKFLMLARTEKLARLSTLYEDATGILSIAEEAGIVAAGDVRTEKGRASIEAFFEKFCQDDVRGPVKLLTAPSNFRFMDSRSGLLSIISMASVDAISKAAGLATLNPLRFRANIYVDGLSAWGEFDLVGKTMKLGSAVVEITARIDRCAATDVEPDTGIRNMNMIRLLENTYGHHDCGVYGRIISSGRVKAGDGFVAFEA
jgi:uncharacterized protein